jgi:hypothetical protein
MEIWDFSVGDTFVNIYNGLNYRVKEVDPIVLEVEGHGYWRRSCFSSDVKDFISTFRDFKHNPKHQYRAGDILTGKWNDAPYLVVEVNGDDITIEYRGDFALSFGLGGSPRWNQQSVSGHRWTYKSEVISENWTPVPPPPPAPVKPKIVASSPVCVIGWDGVTQVTVEFATGAVWVYKRD